MVNKAIMDTRRKKLIYRSRHRGTKEMDIIMGKFADAFIPSCDDVMLNAYEILLDEQDPDLYNWIVGLTPVTIDNVALDKLIAFQKEE
jgi:antitoxin CptB